MMQPSILLTGATGLIGRYLLRRLLNMGLDVACIVRLGRSLVVSNPGQSPSDLARRRIEQVLGPFEEFRLIRRPKAIAWDFSASLHSLAKEDLQWLQDRPIIVVHGAASIRFQEDKVTGEPYRTNVQGIRILLQLSQQLDVRAFHFISTAYVGQHRSQCIVREQLVPEFDTGSNDYEISKQQAERLLYRCSHLAQVFIHRPSIVIGDSQTGFTSTFHGFYAPLQIGWNYAKRFGLSSQASSWFRDYLGLKPEDSKNLVPVNWVAESIADVISRQINGNLPSSLASSPTILHWTNARPVSCNDMQAAIVQAIDQSSGRSNGQMQPPEGSEFVDAVPPSPAQFRNEMAVYETYFQSDPQFDSANSSLISESLPCPLVDRELLLHLGKWAIQANFGWPKPEFPGLPYQDYCQALREIQFDGELLTHSVGQSPTTRSQTILVQLDLLGPGACERLWLAFAGSQAGLNNSGTPQGATIPDGFASLGKLSGRWLLTRQVRSPDYSWTLSLETLVACITGTSDIDRVIADGYWSIEGISPKQGMAIARDWINFLVSR